MAALCSASERRDDPFKKCRQSLFRQKGGRVVAIKPVKNTPWEAILDPAERLAHLYPKIDMTDGLVQWPMIMGAIVPVVNIDGVNAGDLVFDRPTLAAIYLGKITKWDDPAIKKLNPKVNLPSAATSVVHGADGSGTTFNFTNYLSKVSADWKTKVGEGTDVEWPVGVGAKGNEGVAANVSQVRNSIGYVEYAYAKQSKLTYNALVNKAGKTVQPTNDAFQSAASRLMRLATT
jgi:phosphate transport system substrate-binding protein